MICLCLMTDRLLLLPHDSLLQQSQQTRVICLPLLGIDSLLMLPVCVVHILCTVVDITFESNFAF